MRAIRATFVRVVGVFRRRRAERDFEIELEHHLAMHVDDNVRAGMTPAEARRDAIVKLGGIALTRERHRERLGLLWFDQLTQDVRYALRTMRRSPAFALVAMLSLAVGVGANTFVFSVLDSLVLASPPVDRPGRLVFVGGATPDRIGQSYPTYLDLRDRNVTFDGLLTYRLSPMDAEWVDGPARAWGYLTSANYFDVLGLRPSLGRFFRADEDRSGGASSVAVLSYDAWQTHFAGDPAVIGRTIRINRWPLTIVGVAPKGFYGIERVFRSDLWAPITMQPQLDPGGRWLESRSALNVWVAGRLKAGVTSAAAEANLNAIATDLVRRYPNDDAALRFVLTRPGLFGDFLRKPVEAFTFGVLGLAVLVLLITCANLAGVLAARTADREREIALRLSLGASRGRVVRQLITETLVLALIGGGGGAAIAMAAARALGRWRVSADYPLQIDMQMGSHVFVFAFLVSTFAGVAFALAPARHASRANPQAVLKGTGAIGGRRRVPLRDVLVAVQLATCVVLVAACLLSLDGLRQALTMPLGFQPQGAATVAFDLSRSGYHASDGRAFQRRAIEAIRELSGVEHAAYASSLPLTLDSSTNTVFAEGDTAAEAGRDVNHYSVSPDFFSTLGMSLLRGRDVQWADTNEAPRVAVVNEAFARQILHARDPIGSRFRYGRQGRLITIVGVVGDSKLRTLTESPQPAIFDPMAQYPNLATVLVVRSSLPAGPMAATLRKTIANLDPALSLYSVGSVEAAIGLTLLPNQVAAVALTTFGLIAIVLAVVGIHGVVAYAVARRRREIGIRVAIGATRRHIVSLVVGRMAWLLGAGAAAGVVLALLAGPLMMEVVYLASPREPWVFAGVCGLALLIGLAACWGPLRKSLRIEPMAALRAE